jgi:hypothetical protein
MASTNLTSLREFGLEAERLQFPCIDVDGFIVPGQESAHSLTPREENYAYDSTRSSFGQAAARQEARSTTGSRQRPSAEAASRSAAHTVQSLVEAAPYLGLEELDEFYPEAKVAFSSSTELVLQIPIGLFQALPDRALLTLEIPLIARTRLTRSLSQIFTGVPDVRAWATWVEGPFSGIRVTSHHQNPDGCICACLPYQWLRGVHPLMDYISYCVTWLGKVLHEREIGFWPGPQHFGPLARLRRHQLNEYCGCGQERRYRECCYPKDLAMSAYHRWAEQYVAHKTYITELAWQGRTTYAPVLQKIH